MKAVIIFFNVLLATCLYGQLTPQDFIVKQFTTKDGLPSNTVYGCVKDADGYLWFATENGLSQFDGKHFRSYGVNDGMLDNMVIGVEYRNGRIFALGLKGISIGEKMVGKYKFQSIEMNKSSGYRVSTYQNYIIFYSGNTINVYDMMMLIHKKYYLPDTNFYKNIFKNKNSLWVKNGFFKLALDVGNQQIFAMNSPFGEKDNFYLVENNRGLDSIKIMTRTNTGFQLFKSPHQNVLNLNDNEYYRSYVVENNRFKEIMSLDIHSFIPSSCFQIDQNTYMVNSAKKGFYLFEKRRGFQQIEDKNYFDFNQWLRKYNLNHGTKCYEMLPDGRVIAGTGAGVSFYDIEKKAFSKIIFPYRTYSLHYVDPQVLFIGTISGLYRMNLKNSSYQKLNLGTASNFKINSIQKDNTGNLWISTAGSGLKVLDSNLKLFKTYEVRDGLLTNDIFKIQVDKLNRKWFSSNKGLQVLDKDKFYRIDEREGLLSEEVEDFDIRGDTVFIATPLGKQSYIYRPFLTRYEIPVYFNSYAINNQIRDSLPHTLSPDEDKLEFNYIGIYFPSSDNIAYRYKLTKDGEKTDWQNTAETKLIFEKLQSGNYELALQAYHTNYPNVYSKQISKKFKITPPYYNTWWFYVLIATIISGVILYILYRRNKRKLEGIIHEKELAKLKLEALKAEMNPHFIFNILNTIKDAMMEGDFNSSQNLLTKLSKLIRHALYNTKKDFVSLEEEIRFIDEYVGMEQVRFSHKFEYIKNVDSSLLHVEIPTMLLQPFFENAIRHGKIGQLSYKGLLYFEATELGANLIISIRDNGVGLEQSRKNRKNTNPEHQSMALDIIRERLSLFKKTYGIGIKMTMNEIDIEGYKTEVKLWIEKENL